MNNFTMKIGLSVVEAGWLLQRPEGQGVRGMPVAENSPLSLRAEGRPGERPSTSPARTPASFSTQCSQAHSSAPCPERRWAAPAPLYPGMLGLALQTGYLVPEDEIEPLMDELARIHGSELLGWQTAFEASERSVR